MLPVSMSLPGRGPSAGILLRQIESAASGLAICDCDFRTTAAAAQTDPELSPDGRRFLVRRNEPRSSLRVWLTDDCECVQTDTKIPSDARSTAAKLVNLVRAGATAER